MESSLTMNPRPLKSPPTPLRHFHRVRRGRRGHPWYSRQIHCRRRENRRQLVYQDAVTDSTVVARPTEDGAQALIVLDSPAAPSRFVFPIEVAGSPVELRAGSDGSVEIFAQGSTFGTRGAACAVYAAAIVYQANRASNRGMCLKLKYPRFGPKATCRTSTRAGSVADMRLLTLREIKEFTYSNLRGLAAGLIVLLVAGLILGSWLHYQFGEVGQLQRLSR